MAYNVALTIGSEMLKKAGRVGFIMSLIRDLRVALHSFLRTPGLALAVILPLALGVGANASLR